MFSFFFLLKNSLAPLQCYCLGVLNGTGFFLDACFVQYLTSWFNTHSYTACFHEGLYCSNSSGSWSASFPPPTLNHFSLLTCIYNFAAFSSHFYLKTEVAQDDKCAHKCHTSVKLSFSNRLSKTNFKKSITKVFFQPLAFKIHTLQVQL